MNDSEVAGYRDRDIVGGGDPPALRARVKDAVTDLEGYKLLHYVAQTLKFRPKSIGDFLREHANDRGSGVVDYDAIEPWTRVSPHDYESNLREMIRLARAHGASRRAARQRAVGRQSVSSGSPRDRERRTARRSSTASRLSPPRANEWSATSRSASHFASRWCRVSRLRLSMPRKARLLHRPHRARA